MTKKGRKQSWFMMMGKTSMRFFERERVSKIRIPNILFLESHQHLYRLTGTVNIAVRIPNVYYFLSLEPHLFNVATSRAREQTIIIVDKKIINYVEMDSIVHSYLETLYKEQCIYIPPSIIEKNEIELIFSEEN